MKFKFEVKEIWSIPNILCYIRILLIPIFVLSYGKDNYVVATLLVMASGLTDFLDGFIARKFHMVTEFGKLIDPLADKLTQVALIVLLFFRVRWMWVIFILFIAMQLFLLIAGVIMFRKGKKLDGAKWFGKVSTTVFYLVMLTFVATPSLNHTVSTILMVLCGVFLLLSFVLYIKEYITMYRTMENDNLMEQE